MVANATPGQKVRKAETNRAWFAAHPGRHVELNRAWAAAHPEYYAKYRASHPNKEYYAKYRASHPNKNAAESVRKWRKEHPERWLEIKRGNRLLRRERKVLRAWVRLVPWLNKCFICNEAIDSTLRYPNPASESIGHEPPIAWVSARPEYEGTLVLRPEHLICNKRKGARRDAERKEFA